MKIRVFARAGAIALTVLALSGCATRVAGPVDKACYYEAMKATAAVSNPLIQYSERQDVYNACVSMK